MNAMQLGDECSVDGDCGSGLYCLGCSAGFSGSKCVRYTSTNQFKIVVNSQNFLSFESFLEIQNSIFEMGSLLN